MRECESSLKQKSTTGSDPYENNGQKVDGIALNRFNQFMVLAASDPRRTESSRK